ncbi:MAG TPA: undecaprenyldiphospho-muramoylpentapeptide beta-N-acetylglucosaminyltransferase [Nitrospirota bacterium]|jgi:UDP-N-acetylglucosamine--N-acetylmuramyl-(pentapeptide) pyrophosphoryl-undecaprenol N-acetylglucosamine transferase
MKIVIAGGGTGGHLYPGIAVAREIIKDGGEVLFIGTGRGIEARVLPKEGLTLRTIRAGRLKGTGLVERIKTLAGIPLGIIEARKVLKEFGPDAVMGVGGYASFPAVAAAKTLGLPVLLQEQNAYPGLTNRTLGKVADKVALGFAEADRFFPKGKSVFTGNPVRQLSVSDKAEALKFFGLEEGRTTVLAFGGSGGAHTINKGMTDALSYLADLKDSVQFIHQTGQRDFETVEAAYKASGFTARVSAFIYEMDKAYACAGLAVCRSGALTLAELAALGKPALLIPYPFAADNHQEVNARTLESAGAAKVLTDREATGQRLAQEIKSLLSDRKALGIMAEKSGSIGRPDAARAVYEVLRKLIS